MLLLTLELPSTFPSHLISSRGFNAGHTLTALIFIHRCSWHLFCAPGLLLTCSKRSPWSSFMRPQRLLHLGKVPSAFTCWCQKPKNLSSPPPYRKVSLLHLQNVPCPRLFLYILLPIAVQVLVISNVTLISSEPDLLVLFPPHTSLHPAATVMAFYYIYHCRLMTHSSRPHCDIFLYSHTW